MSLYFPENKLLTHKLSGPNVALNLLVLVLVPRYQAKYYAHWSSEGWSARGSL